jgi:hypothetical protein
LVGLVSSDFRENPKIVEFFNRALTLFARDRLPRFSAASAGWLQQLAQGFCKDSDLRYKPDFILCEARNMG